MAILPRAQAKVLITGGSSGIGAGLAAAYHQRGAQVIIAGRTQATLADVAGRYSGMETRVLDVADMDSVAATGSWLEEHHPDLDVVINNAGIQRVVKFDGGKPLSTDELCAELDTNVKGLLAVTNATLPTLLKRPAAQLINIGSGLAFVPLASTPIYCATKAAVHSLTLSLRHQLRQSPHLNSASRAALEPAPAATGFRGRSRGGR